jgi:hypothetical protein
MTLMPMSLRLEAADGSGSEEYRIHDGDIEVRRVASSFERSRYRYEEFGEAEYDWHCLTARELAGHVDSNTVVAQWLRHRIGWRRLLLKCTDQETLQKFGITENVSDRYAA